MPPIEEHDMYDTAVLWAAVGYDKRGQVLVAQPVEISCRWENSPTKVKDSTTNSATSHATVFSAEFIPLGSILWEGTLAAFMGTGSEGYDSGLMEVIGAPNTPDLKARFSRNQYSLSFYRDELPAYG